MTDARSELYQGLTCGLSQARVDCGESCGRLQRSAPDRLIPCEFNGRQLRNCRSVPPSNANQSRSEWASIAALQGRKHVNLRAVEITDPLVFQDKASSAGVESAVVDAKMLTPLDRTHFQCETVHNRWR